MCISKTKLRWKSLTGASLILYNKKQAKRWVTLRPPLSNVSVNESFEIEIVCTRLKYCFGLISFTIVTGNCSLTYYNQREKLSIPILTELATVFVAPDNCTISTAGWAPKNEVISLCQLVFTLKTSSTFAWGWDPFTGMKKVEEKAHRLRFVLWKCWTGSDTFESMRLS